MRSNIWYKEGADVSVLITTKVVRWNPEVYSIQQYVIQFFSDLRQVGGFLLILMFPPLINKDHNDMTEILLEVA